MQPIVEKDLHRLSTEQSRGTGNKIFQSTCDLIAAFFAKELSFKPENCKDLKTCLSEFEANATDEFDTLTTGSLDDRQTQSDIWTFGFWVTHYLLVLSKYSCQKDLLDRHHMSFQDRITEICMWLAKNDLNRPKDRKAPDLVAELVVSLLSICPQIPTEVNHFVSELLKMESDGNLAVEKDMSKDRAVAHGRFVYLAALAAFIWRRKQGTYHDDQ